MRRHSNVSHTSSTGSERSSRRKRRQGRRIKRSNVMNVPDIVVPQVIYQIPTSPTDGCGTLADFSPMSVKTLPTPTRFDLTTPQARVAFSRTPNHYTGEAALAAARALANSVASQDCDNIDTESNDMLGDENLSPKSNSNQQDLFNLFCHEQTQKAIIGLSQKHAMQQHLLAMKFRNEQLSKRVNSTSCPSLPDATPIPDGLLDRETYYKEKRLVNLIEGCLIDTKTNKYYGSVPVVTVQRLTRDGGTDEYSAVVKGIYGGSFHEFLAMQHFTKFRIKHYTESVIEENGLVHCSSHEGRLTFDDVSDSELLIRDKQTATWKQDMWEEVSCWVEDLVRQEPIQMKALMKKIKEENREKTERYQCVLPSNHSLRQLLRKQPERFFISSDSATIKLPSQLNDKERHEWLQKLKEHDHKKNSKDGNPVGKKNIKQLSGNDNYTQPSTQTVPITNNIIHGSNSQHAVMHPSVYSIQQAPRVTLLSHQGQTQQAPLQAHPQSQFAGSFVSQSAVVTGFQRLQNVGIPVQGHATYTESPQLSCSTYSPDLLRLQTPSGTSSCMSTPTVSALNSQFQPYITTDMGHIVSSGGLGHNSIGAPFIPIGHQQYPFTLEAQKVALAGHFAAA